jgi:hypothetical protein
MFASRQDDVVAEDCSKTVANQSNQREKVASIAAPAQILSVEKAMKYLNSHSIPYYLEDSLFLLSRHKQLQEDGMSQPRLTADGTSLTGTSVRSAPNPYLFMYEYFAKLDRGDWMVGREFKHLIATRRTVAMFCNKLDLVLRPADVENNDVAPDKGNFFLIV